MVTETPSGKPPRDRPPLWSRPNLLGLTRRQQNVPAQRSLYPRIVPSRTLSLSPALGCIHLPSPCILVLRRSVPAMLRAACEQPRDVPFPPVIDWFIYTCRSCNTLAMCVGPIPQQPPRMDTPVFRASAAQRTYASGVMIPSSSKSPAPRQESYSFSLAQSKCCNATHLQQDSR